MNPRLKKMAARAIQSSVYAATIAKMFPPTTYAFRNGEPVDVIATPPACDPASIALAQFVTITLIQGTQADTLVLLAPTEHHGGERDGDQTVVISVQTADEHWMGEAPLLGFGDPEAIEWRAEQHPAAFTRFLRPATAPSFN